MAASPISQLCARCRNGGEPITPTAQPDIVDRAELGRPPLLRLKLWETELAGSGTRAVAISNEVPTCRAAGRCTAEVWLECAHGRYIQVLGGASSAVLADSTRTEVGGRAWLDLFDVNPAPVENPARERRRWSFNGLDYNQQTVDCPRVDATQTHLGEPAYPLEGLKLAPGKLLPSQPLPNELFRVPLEWPAASGGLTAIGFEVPGGAAGLAFVYRGCLINTWFYTFGGNGVELTLHEVVHPFGLPALLLVEANGWARGYFPDPEHSDEHVDPSLEPRWLVFAVDTSRARLLVDSEAFPALREGPVSLALLGKTVSLSVGQGPGAQRFRYDAKRESFSGLSDPSKRPAQ